MKTLLQTASVALALGVAAVLSARGLPRVDKTRPVPPPAIDAAPGAATSEVAVLAGGCFWGVQGVTSTSKGVTSAVSGYAGGEPGDGALRAVGRGDTGHAEGGADHLRPAPGQLRHAAADLLLGRARSDRAEPPGPGRRAAVPVDDLPDRAPSRRGSPRPTSRSSTRPTSSTRRSSRRSSPIGRSTPAEDYHQDYLTLHPSSPTSPSTICPRSRR